MASVYVLRSHSSDPQVTGLSHLHKIGSTKRTVEIRTENAIKKSTFLNASVDVVAEYVVPRGLERKVERLLHRLFAAARLDVWFQRNGRTVAQANEWFIVPLPVIDEAITLIVSEAITNYEYDVENERLRLRS